MAQTLQTREIRDAQREDECREAKCVKTLEIVSRQVEFSVRNALSGEGGGEPVRLLMTARLPGLASVRDLEGKILEATQDWAPNGLKLMSENHEILTDETLGKLVFEKLKEDSISAVVPVLYVRNGVAEADFEEIGKKIGNRQRVEMWMGDSITARSLIDEELVPLLKEGNFVKARENVEKFLGFPDYLDDRNLLSDFFANEIGLFTKAQMQALRQRVDELKPTRERPDPRNVKTIKVTMGDDGCKQQ